MRFSHAARVTSTDVVYESIFAWSCFCRLSGKCLWEWVLRGCVAGQNTQAGFGEGLHAHVAAAFDPLIGLLRQHRADEADNGGPVEEDADDVGAAFDLLVQPLEGYLEPAN